MVYNFKLPKQAKTDLNVTSVTDLIGFYDYNTKTCYVNLGSYEFDLPEPGIIRTVAATIMHENVHHCIYEIVGKYWIPTETEEYFIDIMTGEK